LVFPSNGIIIDGIDSDQPGRCEHMRSKDQVTQEKEHAENQNKPCGCQAIQKNRIRQGGLFQVFCQSYTDEKIFKKKTAVAKKSTPHQSKSETSPTSVAQWVSDSGVRSCE